MSSKKKTTTKKPPTPKPRTKKPASRKSTSVEEVLQQSEPEPEPEDPRRVRSEHKGGEEWVIGCDFCGAEGLAAHTDKERDTLVNDHLRRCVPKKEPETKPEEEDPNA